MGRAQRNLSFVLHQYQNFALFRNISPIEKANASVIRRVGSDSDRSGQRWLAADLVAYFNFAFIGIVSGFAIFVDYPNFMRAFR